jgi:alpha-1,3-rhamnosyl/mannosyltransferase
MACGTPVVAGDRASLPEVVGAAGLLVDPDVTASIRDALDSVLSDPDLRRQLAERGRARSKTFTWNRMAEETLAVYRSAAGL